MIDPKPWIKSLNRTVETDSSRLFKHRLDKNERTHPFDKAIVSYIKEHLTDELLMAYPELEPLYQEFSEWLGVNRDQILFHLGSDLAIKSVYETYIKCGDKILLQYPGYAGYKIYADMFQAKVDFLEYDENLNFDFGRYLEKLDGSYKMVVIENPSGFVGNSYPNNAIEELIKKAYRLGVIVLVDEAYYHFIDETAVNCLDEYDNVIITRTFSKAFGLAGLRAGYLISRPDNIKNLYRVRPMHELTSLTALGVSAMLKHRVQFEEYIADTKRCIKYLKTEFQKLDIDTADSCVNFVTAKFSPKLDANELREYLSSKNYLIRQPFREKKLKDWTRVGVAPLEVMEQFIKELKTFIDSKL